MPPPPAVWERGTPFEFDGVPLLDVDVDGAVRSIAEAIAAGRAQGLHLCNAHTLVLAGSDPGYRAELLHPGAVNLPDGTPVAWFYRLASGRPARGPVRGPTLMKTVLDLPGTRHFLLGGTEHLLADLEAEIARRHPAAEVVGRLAPAYRDPTDTDLAAWSEEIRRSGADVVWVGLGTPRQDVVVARLSATTQTVLVGVGAAFDFLSGHKSEAPRILHGTGLEWLYRLVSEPRRLWRRYLVGNTVFVLRSARQLAVLRRRAGSSTER